MKFDSPKPAETDGSSNEWLPVSVAAARLGVSERTVQRRAEKGKVESKEISDEQGKRLLVRLDLPTSGDTLTTGDDAKNGVPTSNDTLTTPPDDISREAAAKVPTPADTGNDAFLAHVLEENKFLRAALEQRDRDAAELRAALREALKMTSRQLTTGEQQEGAERAPVAQDAPPVVPTNNVSLAPQRAPEPAPVAHNGQPRRGHALALIREGLRGLFTR